MTTMDRNMDDQQEQFSSSMGDNTNSAFTSTNNNNARLINSQIQEISIERTKTLTYGVEDTNLRAEVLFLI